MIDKSLSAKRAELRMLDLILNLCNQIVRSGQAAGVVDIGFVLSRIGWICLILGLVMMPMNLANSGSLLFIAGHVFNLARFLILGFLGFKLINSFIQCFRIQSCEELMANRVTEEEVESVLYATAPLETIRAKGHLPINRK